MAELNQRAQQRSHFSPWHRLVTFWLLWLTIIPNLSNLALVGHILVNLDGQDPNFVPPLSEQLVTFLSNLVNQCLNFVSSSTIGTHLNPILSNLVKHNS
jgi:hypothetical protein